MTIRQLEIETAVGLARATVHPGADELASRGVLVLGHGAGGGLGARDLVALAVGLPPLGVSVIGVEAPWRVAGRRVASPPRQLDLAWAAVLTALRAAQEISRPLVVGGRSAGARVACRTAGEVGAHGCVALAFPLHPPGRPERTRVTELTGCPVSTLVVQGERDPFGRPEEFPDGTRLIGVPAADHGFAVPARAVAAGVEVGALIVAAVVAWWVELEAQVRHAVRESPPAP